MRLRRLATLFAWAILILSLQACQSKPASDQVNAQQANSQSSRDSLSGLTSTVSTSDARTFKGSIGGKYKIQMRLLREGEAVTGTYFYENVKNDLALKGAVDKQGSFTLREYDSDGTQTGVFKGRWGESDVGPVELEGTWSKPDGDKEMPFYLVEQLIKFGEGLRFVSKGIKEENKERRYSIEASYPQLEGSSDVRIEKFNQEVKTLVMNEVSQYRQGAGLDPDEEDFSPEAPGDELSIDYNVILATDDLISIQFPVYTYEHGAAHPSHYFMEINYDLKSSRQLKLEEVFKPGANYLQALSSYSVNELKRRSKKADSGLYTDDEWIEKGAAAEPENYSNWNFTNKGLVITFGEYQVAPYAAGPQLVAVPYTALKGILDPDGPLARFL